MTRRSKKVARMAAAGAAVAVVTATGWAERTALAASFTVLAHLHWLWIPAAVGLESVSMAAFAVMLRRPDGCPPSFTPWYLTARDTAPASFLRAGSPRTPAPSSTTWTRAASPARCSLDTPGAAGWRCRRRAWRPAG